MGAPHIADFGKYFKEVACNSASVTAGGAGDNTALTGATINKLGYGSASFIIAYKTTLAATKTLSFAVSYQESADGTNWDTAVTLQASTVALTGAATNATGTVVFDVNLEPLKQYVRFNFTPDLSATDTDTAVVSGVAILGGADKLPAV